MDRVHLKVVSHAIDGVFRQRVEMELGDLEFLRYIHVLGGEVIRLPLGDCVGNRRGETNLGRELIR